MAECRLLSIWTNGTGFGRLLAGLRTAGLDPGDAFAWDPRRSPYPGLASFQSQDAAVFFGREAETERLVQLLQPTLRYGAGRCVAIVGLSGSGKSSLLRAGLLPRLARAHGRWVVLTPLQPGRYPVQALAGCLVRAFANAGFSHTAAELVRELAGGPAALVEWPRGWCGDRTVRSAAVHRGRVPVAAWGGAGGRGGGVEAVAASSG
jgi:hypothetical protein